MVGIRWKVLKKTKKSQRVSLFGLPSSFFGLPSSFFLLP
jgi:hypothetical protein